MVISLAAVVCRSPISSATPSCSVAGLVWLISVATGDGRVETVVVGGTDGTVASEVYVNLHSQTTSFPMDFYKLAYQKSIGVVPNLCYLV